MTRPLRIEFPGSFWHITQRGNERRNTFFDDADRLKFVTLLGQAVLRFQWVLTAYALMSNHFHLVFELTSVDTLSRGLKWLNGTYAQYFNRRYGRVGHLFQGRFRAFLVDKDSYFLEVLRYVVLNPVRANLVETPEQYEWTSYRATAALADAPRWLRVDEVLARFGTDPQQALSLYRRFVEDGVAEPKRLWDDAVAAMYVGPPDWLARVRNRVESQARASEHVRAQRELLRPRMCDIVTSVASTMAIPEDRIRCGHGGTPRAIAAWLGRHEGQLTNGEIAAALRLRSEKQVTNLVAECDRQLHSSRLLREAIDRCITTLGRKNYRLQT